MNQQEYDAEYFQHPDVRRPPPGTIYKELLYTPANRLDVNGTDYINSIRVGIRHMIDIMPLSDLEKIFNVTIVDPVKRYQDWRVFGGVIPSPEEQRHLAELRRREIVEVEVCIELSEVPVMSPNYICHSKKVSEYRLNPSNPSPFPYEKKEPRTEDPGSSDHPQPPSQPRD